MTVQKKIPELKICLNYQSLSQLMPTTPMVAYVMCLTLSGSKFTLSPTKVNPSELILDKCGTSVWQKALASSPVSLLRSRDALCCPSPKKNTSVHCILNTFLRVKSHPLWTLTLGKEASCKPSIGLFKLWKFERIINQEKSISCNICILL